MDDADNSDSKRVIGRPFEAGKGSPNPGGKPKIVREMMELFRNEKDLFYIKGRLMEIITSQDHKEAILGIREWHDRAYGKAPLAVVDEEGKSLRVGVIILPADAADAGE